MSAIIVRGDSVRRRVLASLGIVSVGLAIVGVFVPGLPSTEFVLAASYLFARSSPTLDAWLNRNRWLGPSLRKFRETRGMPRKVKALLLVWMWTGIGISAYTLATAGAAAQIGVVALGVMGTVSILFFVRTTGARQSLILS
jgi:uncharacterized protein